MRQQKKWIFSILVLSFVLLGSFGHAEAQKIKQKRIDMFVGEQKIIAGANIKEFVEKDEGRKDAAVEVRMASNKIDLILIAHKAGSSSLLVLNHDGTRIQYSISVQEIRVTERDNIRLDFYFVEFTRDENMQIGVGWPGTIGGTGALEVTKGLIPHTATTATASLTAEVLPKIDMLQATSWAKILRESSVVMANGEKSSFETGGELNFAISGTNSSSIEKISFGSKVQVQPRYDRTTKRLDITISAVVSELTAAQGGGLPGRTFTNLSTVVNMELGQSIVLAGIHATSGGHGIGGLPFLSQIPVLGLLFSSQNFRENEVENLIFIVPTVVQAVKIEHRDRVEEAQRTFKNFEGEVDGTLLYGKYMRRPISARRQQRKKQR